DTETFVALAMEIDSWRWAGVPFSIRAGKALAATVQEAVVEFKHPPRALFADASYRPEPNVLRFRMKPDDQITLSMQAKLPGSRLGPRAGRLDGREGGGARGGGARAVRAADGRGHGRRRAPLRPPGLGRGRLAGGRAGAEVARPRPPVHARRLGAARGGPRAA